MSTLAAIGITILLLWLISRLAGSNKLTEPGGIHAKRERKP